jgi:hypothetical protein
MGSARVLALGVSCSLTLLVGWTPRLVSHVTDHVASCSSRLRANPGMVDTAGDPAN